VSTYVEEIAMQLEALGVRAHALRTDSRAVRAGDVFLAYPGAHSDGRRHIGDAIAAGASAVLWEKNGYAWNEAWRVPNLAVEGLRQTAGALADVIYGHPSERVAVIAITGTNGKTTCSQWIAQAYAHFGRRAGVIGTLGIGYPGAYEPSPNTTPDPVVLQEALKRFADDGAAAVALEASSIGIEQGRLNGVRVRTAVFTNLSRDHLDYHPNMEAYAQAKLKLFLRPGLRHAVLNMDDVAGVRIAQSLEAEGVERVAYSLTRDVARSSGLERFVEAHHVRLSADGVSFDLVSSWGNARIETALLGRFNVANILAVAGALLVSGFSLAQVAEAARHFQPAAGRMQRAGGGEMPLVVIDYAHTPDALEKVLGALRDVARKQQGRLWCVFGCGGDRDRGKRPLMGEAVSRYADRAIVTSDNPRSEDPLAIVAEILPGLSITHDIEIDRRAAIRLAVSQARRGDVILIAGKGHEPYQEIAGQRLPFSDLDEARRALEERQS